MSKGSLAFSPEELSEVYPQPKAFFADGVARKVVVLNKVLEKRDGKNGPYTNVIWTFADATTFEPYETRGVTFPLTNALSPFKEKIRLETSIFAITATCTGKNAKGYDEFSYAVEYIGEQDGNSPKASSDQAF